VVAIDASQLTSMKLKINAGHDPSAHEGWSRQPDTSVNASWVGNREDFLSCLLADKRPLGYVPSRRFGGMRYTRPIVG